jgi:hypothetical protein
MALFEDLLISFGVEFVKSLIIQDYGPGTCRHCGGSGKCTCLGCYHVMRIPAPKPGEGWFEVHCTVCRGTGRISE